MSVKIYCIEDINDLKYIGSTTQKLNDRLSQHRRYLNCSSNKLNLHNCIIYELENCNKEDRVEREQYYINNINCINIRNATYDKKEYNIEYREKNRDRLRKKNREYYHKNKETESERKRLYYLKKKSI